MGRERAARVSALLPYSGRYQIACTLTTAIAATRRGPAGAPGEGPGRTAPSGQGSAIDTYLG